MSSHDKVAKMMESKVDLGNMQPIGSCLNLHEKLCMDLAQAYEEQKDPNYCVVSWESQEKAQNYFNEHGFEKTLEHLMEVKK